MYALVIVIHFQIISMLMTPLNGSFILLHKINQFLNKSLIPQCYFSWQWYILLYMDNHTRLFYIPLCSVSPHSQIFESFSVDQVPCINHFTIMKLCSLHTRCMNMIWTFDEFKPYYSFLNFYFLSDPIISLNQLVWKLENGSSKRIIVCFLSSCQFFSLQAVIKEIFFSHFST